MTLDEFNDICGALPATELTHPFGEQHVWKVGGKMFAIAHQPSDEVFAKISFKVPEETFEMLIEEKGVIAAPYMARALWIQITEADSMSNDDIRGYISYSHKAYTAKLTRAKRAELGLD